MPTILIRKIDAAEQVGYHPEYIMKLATRPEYAHVGFPKPVRLGKNSVAFVQSEIDEWIEVRIKERDDVGFKPKAVNPRENHRKAKQRAGAV